MASTPLPPSTPAQPIRTARGTQPEASPSLVRKLMPAVTAALPRRGQSPRPVRRTQAGSAGTSRPLLIRPDQVTARARRRPVAPRPLNRTGQSTRGHSGVGRLASDHPYAWARSRRSGRFGPRRKRTAEGCRSTTSERVPQRSAGRPPRRAVPPHVRGGRQRVAR